MFLNKYLQIVTKCDGNSYQQLSVNNKNLCYNQTMKKGLGLLILAVGVVLAGNVAFAKSAYTIVPIPDTVVQKTPLDAAIYTNTAEFFTPYIVNEINKTQFMHAPTVTDVRSKIQSDYWLTKTTTKAMDDFRRFYKLDFEFAKKMAKLYDTNYVLLITSATDSTNYITRRTWWDFFNVPGASVLDPAYKINIYAVLIDTDNELIVWNKSYQKTISVVENRIVATGYAPQTEQLQKIKDYSVYLAPRVARSLQDTLLTPAQKTVEANRIHTDYGSIDNVFTKKYRGLRQEIIDASVVPAVKAREGYGVVKEKYNESKEAIQTKLQENAQKRDNTDSNQGIVPLGFFKKSKPVTVTPVVEQEIPVQQLEPVEVIKNNVQEVSKDVVQSIESASTTVVEEVKTLPEKVEQVLNIQTSEPEVKQALVVIQAEVIAPVKTVEKAVNNAQTLPEVESVKTPEVISVAPKELKIDKDIDKKSQAILKKAFKNKPIDGNELPVDSMIYTSPSDYLPTNYLPMKPRLREINTNDTYNAF